MLRCEMPAARSIDASAPSPGVHWNEIARLWSNVGSPLRPTAPDLAAYTAAIRQWVAENSVPRALILGVTPELYRLPWPKGTDVAAVDHTQRMIEMIWPGPRHAAICADWTDMPLQTDSRDIAVCDGGIILLAYPEGHARLVRSLHRVLAPNGLFVSRLNLMPLRRESPEAVLRDLLDARIPNLNILKLRLGMALQESSKRGVQLAHIWNTLKQIAGDFSVLATRIGWPLEHLAAIDTYRDCPNRYSYLTLAEVIALFTENPGGFEFESLHMPDYPLGERCPTVVFRRGRSAPFGGDD